MSGRPSRKRKAPSSFAQEQHDDRDGRLRRRVQVAIARSLGEDVAVNQDDLEEPALDDSSDEDVPVFDLDPPSSDDDADVVPAPPVPPQDAVDTAWTRDHVAFNPLDFNGFVDPPVVLFVFFS
jgi:hypothetical protein